MRKANATAERKVFAIPKRNRYTAAEWPCVFLGRFVRDQIDPRIKVEWAARRSDQPKWGDLRNTFRREHCRTLNPWGSESCPYPEEDCAITFLKAVQNSLSATNPHAYLIKVARSLGAARADAAVEIRARMRTDVNPQSIRVGSPDPAGVRARLDAVVAPDAGGQAPAGVVPSPASRDGVRSPFARPGHIGAVLGSLDLRPRPLPDDPEQKGPR